MVLEAQAWAEKHWPARSPVGERIRLRGLGETEARTIVGVVSNVLLGNPLSRRRSADAVYIPLNQADVTAATILFRHRGDAVAAQAALYDALAVTDPKLPPPSVATFDEILAKTTLLAKSVSRLFGLCFGFALLLAVSGTYGLMARSIGRRAREIGIRRALGATDSIVVRLLLRQGGRQLGIGVLLAVPVMALVGIGFWRFFPIGLGVSLGSGLLVATTIVGVVLAATYLPTDACCASLRATRSGVTELSASDQKRAAFTGTAATSRGGPP
ncbi:MAG TPA: FtsX-like permease family protein [Longimicrobiales bacterium]|nr:FtsX-like permease family protein [Longimicrobiales bacterium]